MKMCTVDSCDRPFVARGMCRMHYNREYRKGLEPLDSRPPRGIPHIDCPKHPEPDRACYMRDRCRCDECRRLNALYQQQLVRRRAQGRVDLHDATPARRRIAELRRQGVGLRRIAAETGLNRISLSNVASGKTKRVRSRTLRILADYQPEPTFVDVDDDLAQRVLDVQGRRSWDWAADHFGISRKQLYDISRKRTKTKTSTRDQIMAAPVPCADCDGWAMAGGRWCFGCYRDRANPRSLRGCGTPSGYQRHRRNGTTPCDACRQAHAAAVAMRREAS